MGAAVGNSGILITISAFAYDSRQADRTVGRLLSTPKHTMCSNLSSLLNE